MEKYVVAIQAFLAAGACRNKENAQAQVEKLTKAGFAAIIKTTSGLYYVQAGAFKNQDTVKALVDKLGKVGFDAIIKDA